MRTDTEQMAVENTAFLLERLASDCSPDQYIRELTKNSFQAIQERRKHGWDGEGSVIWDVDWNHSSRKASTGRMETARIAGPMALITPTKIKTPSANKADRKSTRGLLKKSCSTNGAMP